MRQAIRRLARAPGFAAIAILTIALGIGANTAIFSLVQAVVLRPLPYGDADRLVMIWGTRDRGETTWLSGPEIAAYRDASSAFSNVAVWSTTAVNLTGTQEPEQVSAARVTPDLFATLRVPALVGRRFAPSDSAATIADQVVISYGLWQRRFGGDRDVVGRRIQVDGTARTVVGVMPASFQLPLDFGEGSASDLWLPLDLREFNGRWGDHSFLGIARLQDGVGTMAATGTMRRLEQQWVRDGNWRANGIAERSAVPVQDLVLGDVRVALWILLGAVGVILLIACANVANLMLARSDERHREVAVRTALGASRWRIVGQLLSESMLISTLGGVLGITIACGGLRVLRAVQPAAIPRVGDVGIDAGVLAFTILLVGVAGVLFGLAPALELSRADVARALREGGRTGSVGRSRQRFRDALAVSQLAFSVVLLIGAVLLVRSFVELRRVDLGFQTSNVLTARTSLPALTYADEAVVPFYRSLRARLGELPGVESVGATRLLPLTGTIGDWSITIEGRVRKPGENFNGDWQVVTPGYFETMGMQLVRGRFLEDNDTRASTLVAVINETMARRYWGDEDPIGRRFHLGSDPRPWVTIVGIVGTVRHNAITEAPRAEMYMAPAQWNAAGASVRRAMTFVLRTSGDPLALLPYVRETVRSMDPDLPLSDVRTLDAVAANALAEARFTTQLLTLFAVLALVLATIGIYGVMSLLVTRRGHELGIRMALGAQPGAMVKMVVRRGMLLAASGVGIGLVAAVAVSSVVASLLYGVTRFDPVTFLVVPVILATVALLACLIPARKAGEVDPVVALREE
jgi:putative ABC transport system permease protein